MTHRGPFQPLLFCDSVKLYGHSFPNSTDIQDDHRVRNLPGTDAAWSKTATASLLVRHSKLLLSLQCSDQKAGDKAGNTPQQNQALAWYQDKGFNTLLDSG